MACELFCLRTEGLTGADPGGNWTLIDGSYSGDLIGDDPCITWADLGVGLNTFEYCGPACNSMDCVSIDLYKMAIGNNQDQTISVCVSDPPFFVRDYFNAGVDGTIQIFDQAGNELDLINDEDEVDPADLVYPGSMFFTIRITGTPPAGYTTICACVDEFTLTVNSVETGEAGTGSNNAAC